MSSQPLVSVCIPSYNHAQYLPYCIESILAQTYPNIEIIIVDDNSKDDSLAVAQSYANQYPDKVAVYTHPNRENRGISNTVNYAFSLSKGKYWSGLPSDDALKPHKIAKQVEFLEANRQLGFVYCYASFMDGKGDPLPGTFGEDITKNADPVKTLLKANVIPGMTVLARHDAVEEVGLHDPNLIYSDWDFWIRLFLLFKGGFIPESLVEYRVHDYNTSVGIPMLKILGYIKEVYLKLDSDRDEKIWKLRQPVYRNIISDELKNVSLREANVHLDQYFISAKAKDYSAAQTALKKAFGVCPQVFLQPRRTIAVLKHLVLRTKN